MIEPMQGPLAIPVLVWTHGLQVDWAPCIGRLLALPDTGEIVVASDEPADRFPADARLRVVAGHDLGGLLLELTGVGESVLTITAPTVLPVDGLGSVSALLRADHRVAAVAPWCSDAGHLSFSCGEEPGVTGLDETSLTRRLRECEPHLGPVPIACLAGPALLLSSDAVVVLGSTDPELEEDPELALADLGLRGLRRGLRTVLDPSTYVVGPRGSLPGARRGADSAEGLAALASRHDSLATVLEEETTESASPLGLALSVCATKVRGLRILVDGTCLGPVENGTQVQMLATIEALCRREDVQYVGVGVVQGVPDYAERALGHPKVQVLSTPTGRFGPAAPHADVVHRPFQPGPLPWRNFRAKADRVVVTVQDLIAYANGSYHQPGEWAVYRTHLRNGTRNADGVVVL